MWILGGLAAIIFAVAFYVIPTDAPRPADRRIDWVGAVLVTAGLIGLQFAISQAPIAPNGWKTNCK
jgi:hypothetical protein